MRRTIALLAAGVLLAGCGAKADLGAQPVATEATTSAPSSQALSEAQYLEMVRGLSYAQPAITDAMLVNLATSLCKALTGDSISGPMSDPVTWLPWKHVITTLTEGGWSAEEAGSFVVYAAAYACPEKMAEYLPPT